MSPEEVRTEERQQVGQSFGKLSQFPVRTGEEFLHLCLRPTSPCDQIWSFVSAHYSLLSLGLWSLFCPAGLSPTEPSKPKTKVQKGLITVRVLASLPSLARRRPSTRILDICLVLQDENIQNLQPGEHLSGSRRCCIAVVTLSSSAAARGLQRTHQLLCCCSSDVS